MEKLKDSAFVKLVCPVGKYWDDKDRTNKTKRKRNTVTLKDNAQKVDGQEHTLVVNKQAPKIGLRIKVNGNTLFKTIVLQKAQWEMAAPNTDIVALLLIIEDIIHNKVEQVQGAMGLVESNMIVYTTTLDLKDTLNEYY